jgi:hypothetical protein
MSQTKVSDALRNVTAVDAVKLTGTVDNARITLDAAEIPSLDADKITTGSIDAARIPAGAVTQHVQATDLTAVHQAIATLGLHTAVSDNKAAFNLPNAFIDTFEDDTGITTETTTDRNVGEYVSSVSTSTGSQAQIARGDGTAIGTMTSYTGLTTSFDGVLVEASGSTSSSTSNHIAWIGKDWGSGVTHTVNGFKYYGPSSGDGVSDAANSSGCSLTLHGNSVDNTATAVNLGGLTNQDFSNGNLGYIFTKLSGLTTTTAYRFHWIKVETTLVANWLHCAELQFFEDPVVITTNATGTLVSTVQTAPSATTEVSGVILYTDESGTNTIGTDLEIYLTANLQGTTPNWTGTNWTEAASYGTAQTFSGTTKQVKLGKTTVTSGTAVALKGVWANQVATVAGTYATGDRTGGYVTGDRTSSITVTTSMTIGGGAITNFVDGVSASNTTNGFYWNGSVNPSGEWVQFEFSTSKIITEAKLYTYANSDTHGIWKWQGSNNASSWPDIGSNFTWQGATGGGALTELNGNTNSYTYYRILGISGSTMNNFQKELEFKEAASITVTNNGSGWSSEAPDSTYVNGNKTAGSSTGWYTTGTPNASGLWIRFEFATTQTLIEARMYKDNAGIQTYGVWKWQGSNVAGGASGYVDIGSSFTLGGDDDVTNTSMSGNTIAYKYYQLTGVSGTVSGAHTNTEIEFKSLGVTGKVAQLNGWAVNY